MIGKLPERGPRSSARLAYPVWMLALIAVTIVRREIVWCTAGGAVGLGVQLVAARAWRNGARGLPIANLLTLLRLAIVVSLPLVLASLPRAAFVALVVSLLVLDGLDGRVARARGEASEVGATFDMETDALTVMVLAILLWRDVAIGPWVLIAGLWRYVFALATALLPSLGDSPRSRIYRWLFTCLMIALAGAFVAPPSLARAFAAMGTTMVSFSFVHAMARSRAFRAKSIE